MATITLAQARRRSKWLLAVHEAGHAIVALRLGVDVSKATIVPEGDLSGAVHHGPLTARETIFITLAGPIAERMANQRDTEYDISLGREESEILDLLPEYAEEIGVTLDDDEDDPAERQLQLRELHQNVANEVTEKLRQEWAAVEQLAHGLIEHETLAGPQLRARAF